MKKSEMIAKIYDASIKDLYGKHIVGRGGEKAIVEYIVNKAEGFGMLPPNKPCGVKFNSGAECTCGSNEWEPEEKEGANSDEQ